MPLEAPVMSAFPYWVAMDAHPTTSGSSSIPGAARAPPGATPGRRAPRPRGRAPAAEDLQAGVDRPRQAAERVAALQQQHQPPAAHLLGELLEGAAHRGEP